MMDEREFLARLAGAKLDALTKQVCGPPLNMTRQFKAFVFDEDNLDREGAFIALDDWNPRNDANQALQCVRAVGALGFEFKERLLDAIYQAWKKENKADADSKTWFELSEWHLLTATPSQQIDAILAIREAVEEAMEARG